MGSNDNGKLCYSAREAGALLGLSKNSVYQAVARGELPALRIGARVLIPKASLERMLEDAAKPAGVQE